MRVMTRNLFLGADLTPAHRALAAPDGPVDVPAAIAAIFNPGDPPGLVQRTDFATRAVALADEIEAARPDLIGLQEAALWRAGDAAWDHLELLEAELARRGLRYRRAGVKVNGDVTLPSAAGFAVGLADREAILARDAPELEVSGVRAGDFDSTLPLPTAQGTFRGARPTSVSSRPASRTGGCRRIPGTSTGSPAATASRWTTRTTTCGPGSTSS